MLEAVLAAPNDERAFETFLIASSSMSMVSVVESASAAATLAVAPMSMISSRPPVPALPMAADISVLVTGSDRSPSAPTWNVTVPAVSSLMPLNSVLPAMSEISLPSCWTSAEIACLSLGLERAVGVLDLEVADALEHRMHLVERALAGLHHRDGVLRVALRLGEPADLPAHLLEMASPAASSAARFTR